VYAEADIAPSGIAAVDADDLQVVQVNQVQHASSSTVLDLKDKDNSCNRLVCLLNVPGAIDQRCFILRTSTRTVGKSSERYQRIQASKY
jgi:hypothetical protein